MRAYASWGGSVPPNVRASWSAVPKWAVRDSGDALLVHAVHGDGIVGLIIDIQGAGSGASKTAWSLAALGSQLASEGADAATVAIMINRALFRRRGGRVQADVGVVLWEPDMGATTATYGSVLVVRAQPADEPVPASDQPAGLDRAALPATAFHPLVGDAIMMCSDGIASNPQDLPALPRWDGASPWTAETFLAEAVARDKGRPRNDMSVIVMSVSEPESPPYCQAGALSVSGRRSVQPREVADAHASES